jgi:hypothetical protein
MKERSEYFYDWKKVLLDNGEVSKRVILVLGLLEEKDTVNTIVKDVSADKYGRRGKLFYDRKNRTKTLTLAYAICNPTDEFDLTQGVELAKKRIEKGDIIGKLTSTSRSMLNHDQIEAIISNEIYYIEDNIDTYIRPKRKKGDKVRRINKKNNAIDNVNTVNDKVPYVDPRNIVVGKNIVIRKKGTRNIPIE